MRTLLLVLLAQALPNPTLTPGYADPAVTQETIHQTICVPGYTAKVRHVTVAMKRVVFARYHIPWSERSKYEVDHLVSLEAGGDNRIENLWPEPWGGPEGAHAKDVEENRIHRKICSGEITLEEGQIILASDWRLSRPDGGNGH